MKLKQCIIIVAVILLATAFFAYSQEDNTPTDDYPTLDNTVFDNPQRTPAIFDHDDHNEKAELEDDCAVCHHIYEGNKLVEDESSEDSPCSECHSLKKSDENSVPLRMAYHQRCKECHFDSNKGPILCGECHIKR